MKCDDIGLPRSLAQAAEGDVRAMLEWHRSGTMLYTLVQEGYRRGEPVMVNGYTVQISGSPHHTVAETEAMAERIHAALSAGGSASAAAARLAAEEMRERAARTASSMEHSLGGQGRISCVSCANEIAHAIRELPLPPSSSPEDQEKTKAAATLSIADPDGEANHG